MVSNDLSLRNFQFVKKIDPSKINFIDPKFEFQNKHSFEKKRHTDVGVIHH